MSLDYEISPRQFSSSGVWPLKPEDLAWADLNILNSNI
jgi:hypothetical protein